MDPAGGTGLGWPCTLWGAGWRDPGAGEAEGCCVGASGVWGSPQSPGCGGGPQALLPSRTGGCVRAPEGPGGGEISDLPRPPALRHPGLGVGARCSGSEPPLPAAPLEALPARGRGRRRGGDFVLRGPLLHIHEVMSEGEPSAPRPPGTAISWPRRRRRRRDGPGPGAAERLRAGRGRPPGTGTRSRSAPLLAAGKKLEIPRSLPGQPGGAEEPGDDGGAGAMELKRGMALPRLLLLGLWAAALRDGAAAAAGEAPAALRGRGGSGLGYRWPRGSAAPLRFRAQPGAAPRGAVPRGAPGAGQRPGSVPCPCTAAAIRSARG